MPKHKTVKAFNIDFNWDYLGRPASPGLYAHADPKEHIRFYKDLGANTIQTFCVTYNGYAWYPSEVAPVTPGLKRNFLGEITELGHQEGMPVLGYFCMGSNPRWERKNPALAHVEIAHRNTCKIPFTLEYLNFFCRSIKDALRKTDIDGFMIDWFRPPMKQVWLDCEKKMFQELMCRPFPPQGEPDADELTEYNLRAMERAWIHVKEATDSTRQVIIWTNHPFEKADDSLWTGHRLLKEVDWVLNEAPDITFLDWLKKQVGSHAKIIQNLCGWMDHDASLWKKIDPAQFGLFGFAQADPGTTLVSLSGSDASASNARNTEILREAYHARITC